MPGLCPVAVLLRIISGRDAEYCSGAEYFGEIDRVLTTVILRHEETALGIEDVPPDSSVRSRFFCIRIHLSAR
ncbi:hypothetical protein BDD14_5876 [Edaphobacter modestus]|uniref:Uncharacterized protein n=1 Tax=Edaphobacter modestus TaxID=388466 RepID=A0A4Q7YG72_9BACT|nr:hypothetical protein BDD14_5876 [Edaphobacter modestus]